MQTEGRTQFRTGLPDLNPAGARGGFAVVLMNLGTPDRPDPEAVRPYLVEFLSDPEVISLPRGWRWATPLLARLIAFFRAKGSAANYAMIWTDRGSPLLSISNDQAFALERELGESARVFVAMRYGRPSLGSVFEEIASEGIHDVVLLPMYPHYAGPTIGTALQAAYALLGQTGLRWNVHVLSSWHLFEPYLEAQAAVITRHLAENHLSPEKSVLLFSAHSMPVSYIRAGDPYQMEVEASIRAISGRLEWPSDRIRISYQSRLGPVEWLGPSTEHVLKELAAKGDRQVAVVPISFTADCVETLHEIGIEYRKLFEHELGGKLHLVPALNDDPGFIAALRALVERTIGGMN